MADRELAPAIHPSVASLDQPLVWLASFPKSGNTWTRVLIANYLGVSEPEAGGRIVTLGSISGDRSGFDNATGLPSSDLTADEIDLLRPAAYRRMAQAEVTPIFVKAHDGYYRNVAGEGIFPADCTRGVILLVRHPMDVALSYAFHLGYRDCDHAVERLSDADHVMAGESKWQLHQRTLGWSGHYLSWTRQAEIAVLVIRYEDMLADTARQLARMLDFLGLRQGPDDRLAQAVEMSRFDRLKEIETRNGFAERPAEAERFFRSGRAGEGVANLPDHLKHRICDAHGAVMDELGYGPDGTVDR